MKSRVLLVDDEPAIADWLRIVLEGEGYDVGVAADSASAPGQMTEREFSLALVDLILPDGDGLQLLQQLKSQGSLARSDHHDRALLHRQGGGGHQAGRLLLRRQALRRRRDAHAGEQGAGAAAPAGRDLRSAAAAGRAGRPTARCSGRLAGDQARMFEMLESVAGSDANVLIVGESGTGKELAANALHAQEHARDGPMVKINCAALPKDLIESELFGHVKGAFTGATTDKAGLLEEAHKGSLLLDEITEMPMDLQAKLLRVLEDRQVRRLGGAKTVPVDFRLHLLDQPRPRAGGARGPAAPGPLLPHQHGDGGDAAAARARAPTSPILAQVLPRALSRQARSGRSRPSIPRPTGGCSATRGRATCASSSTRSSARCWWPAGGRSRWPTCRSRCRAEVGSARRASRPPSGVAGGDRARVHRPGARVHRLEQAGRGRGARAPPAHAVLQDAPARHSAAPAVTVPPRTLRRQSRNAGAPRRLQLTTWNCGVPGLGSLIATQGAGPSTHADHVDR